MCMVERSALNVLLPSALKASSLGTSRYAKDRLIAKALHGPAEPERVAVCISAVEVKFAIKSGCVFQESRRLLIIADQARTWNVCVRYERENRLRKRGDAARRDDIIWKCRSTCWRYRNGVSTCVQNQVCVCRVARLIGIVDRLRDSPEISAAEGIGRQ